jgi:actin-related protein
MSTEKSPLIVDFGSKYTKIGFVGETSPRSIILTPAELFNFDEGATSEQTSAALTSVMNAMSKSKDFEHKLEDFLYQVLYRELIINPKDRVMIIPDNFLMPRAFYVSVAGLLFSKFLLAKVYIVPGLSLPLYLTGLNSGVLVECSHLGTQVLPIFDGYPLMPAYVVSGSGGKKITAKVREQLLVENTALKAVALPSRVCDEIEAKFAFLPLRNQYEEYTKDEASVNEMKGKVYEHFAGGKSLKLSYFTRLYPMHSALFGDVDNDETNIAYDVLKSLEKVDISCLKKVCGNLIISGGCVLIKNFMRRFRQEFTHLLATRPEFTRLRAVEDSVKIKQLPYFPNLHTYLGASVIAPLSGLEKYAITSQTYIANNQTIPELVSDLFFEFDRKASAKLCEDVEKPFGIY